MQGRKERKKFDGGYASTIQGAEAFFNKPSPFQKAAQYKAQEDAKASANDSNLTEDATDRAETAAGTGEEIMEVSKYP